ncbi:MAG: hypothetical protein WCF85_04000 [Rhodospirillaceae bacterium]
MRRLYIIPVGLALAANVYLIYYFQITGTWREIFESLEPWQMLIFVAGINIAGVALLTSMLKFIDYLRG